MNVCSFITQISFFVIPEKFFNCKCIIYSKLNLITNIDFVVTLGPDCI